MYQKETLFNTDAQRHEVARRFPRLGAGSGNEGNYASPVLFFSVSNVLEMELPESLNIFWISSTGVWYLSDQYSISRECVKFLWVFSPVFVPVSTFFMITVWILMK